LVGVVERDGAEKGYPVLLTVSVWLPPVVHRPRKCELYWPMPESLRSRAIAGYVRAPPYASTDPPFRIRN
jgi:hypothetical protein